MAELQVWATEEVGAELETKGVDYSKLQFKVAESRLADERRECYWEVVHS